MIIFEPSIIEKYFFDSIVINDLRKFKSLSDIIVTNWCDDNIMDVLDKVYTRDLYYRD